jgi:pimeloyl-ACP methyl ester carboxylesterase
VYWDQRFAGSSFGNPPEDTISVDSFVRDTDAVLTVLRDRFHFRSLFLLGHSWGGALGTAYLLDPVRQAKVTGWIDVDGAHNIPLGNRLFRQSIVDYGNAYLAATPNGADASYWRDALDFLKANPLVTMANIGQIFGYLSKMDASDENTKATPWVLGMLFASPIGLEIMQCNYLSKWDLTSLDFSAGMKAITLPSLVIWGTKDPRFPKAMAQDAYDCLGTPPARKSLVLFAESGHSPMIGEPEKFAAVVGGFVETYK